MTRREPGRVGRHGPRHATRARRVGRPVLALGALAAVVGLVTAAELASRPSVAPAVATRTAVKAGAPAQPSPTATPSAPGTALVTIPGMDLPDAFLLDDGPAYDMFLSTAFGDHLHRHVPVYEGTPGHFVSRGDALPLVPTWASSTGPVWAPDVVHLNGQYLLYSAPQLLRRAPATHCIGVARSSSSLGPYAPVGSAPLVCQLSLGGDIDPQVFADPDGPEGPGHPDYLIWKSDNNNRPGSGPTTIWAAPLANDGLRLTGTPVAIFRPDRAWQEPVLEAPQMVRSPLGGDWLIFSAGRGFYTADYAMGAAPCNGPLGGCHAISSGPFLASNAQGAGPGEETTYVAPGDRVWVLYSPWHNGIDRKLFRPVEAVPLGWRPTGPYPAAQTPFPAP